MAPTPIALDAVAISAMYLTGNERSRELVIVPQMAQRIKQVEYWGIFPGEKVLEIGCGQGDTTLVLAHAVGEQGHVTALDPASLDYGQCLRG